MYRHVSFFYNGEWILGGEFVESNKIIFISIIYFVWHQSCLWVFGMTFFHSSNNSFWRMPMKTSVIKSLLASTALAWGSSAYAVNVGGITWDPNSFFDFSMQEAIFENNVDSVGQTLTFYGEVSHINGLNNGSFLDGALELTFYGTAVVKEFGDFDGNGTVDVIFDNLTVTFYADQDAADFDPSNPATATDGIVWLVLQGHSTDRAYNGSTHTGELFAELNGGLDFADPGDAGSGFAAFDVIGGEAAPYFDTDTITNLAGQTLSNGPADFSFTTSFQPVINDPTGETLFGTGELTGRSRVVPEPATLSLLGLGLLGMRSRVSRKTK